MMDESTNVNFLSDVWMKPDKNNGFIYLYTLDNGEQYVGQTRHTVFQRFVEHKRGESLVDKKIRKHSLSIYTIGQYPIEQLNDKESMFIRIFDTIYPKGLNLESGGGVMKKLNESTVDLLSKSISSAHKNGKYADKYKKQSVFMKKYHQNNPHPMNKKVVCLETGEVFVNEKEVADTLGILQTRVCEVLHKHSKRAGFIMKGHHWAFYDELSNHTAQELIDRIESTRQRPKKVVRVEDGKEYNSVKDVANELNVSYWAINKCIVGNNKRCKGFHFIKKGDYPSEFTKDEIIKIIENR